ncbi:oxidoreductase [Endogone sp. FLAS-F59071]|nr:oxidoreductase [Endogone sp. FLAS-F59071]|eukprot:RUS17914.1 oxidoreductase [Endogone sp. FLAS-F59071]
MYVESDHPGYRTTTEQVLSRTDIDVRGKTFLVTGATSGLGEETVRSLARHGAKIVFSARNLAAAEKVVAQIKAETPTADVMYYKLDLSSLASVKAFAEEVKASGIQINTLICNAGILSYYSYSKTVDGFELQFGTNHVAHFLLTRLLIDNLINNSPSRVIVVSSLGHRRGPVRFDDYNFEKGPYNGWEAYAQSKTANILFASHLNKLYASKGVEAFSLHPGLISTPILNRVSEEDILRLGYRDEEGNLASFFKTVPQGAATQVWAATAPELTGKGGAYLEDVHVSEAVTEQARDPAAAERLWVLTEELVKSYL